MLWDRYPLLPYTVVVPWPQIESGGNIDWIDSVNVVQGWLESNIGPHYVQWVWNMWTLHQSYHCGVSFKLERNCTLFLLRFGS
jgi:hypothetical protein